MMLLMVLSIYVTLQIIQLEVMVELFIGMEVATVNYLIQISQIILQVYLMVTVVLYIGVIVTMDIFIIADSYPTKF